MDVTDFSLSEEHVPFNLVHALFFNWKENACVEEAFFYWECGARSGNSEIEALLVINERRTPSR